MIISFTGTRRGMTTEQKARVLTLLKDEYGIVHGDCIGADADFHQLAIIAGITHIVIRPGHDRFKRTPTRAFCHESLLTREHGIICTVHGAEPYLIRDDKIVADGDALIATPKGYIEEWRGSGTWATIRRAAGRSKPTNVVWPDGRVEPYDAYRRR